MNISIKQPARFANKAIFLCAILIMPRLGLGEIIWNGDCADGNFLQYHAEGLSNEVHFHHMPVYGRPIQYGGQHWLHVGNGDLLSLVARTSRAVNGIHYPAGPTRGGSHYAIEFTIKNSVTGTEPDDCDNNDNTCDQRRTNIQQNLNWNVDYNALPAKTERYLAFSIFVPNDFDARSGGFGPVVWASKAFGGGGPAWAELELRNNGWVFWHRPSTTDSNVGSWWHSMEYSHARPSASYWPQGLVDFPDEAASKAALANINRGGWTDFIIYFKSDNSLPVENNSGFLDVYMRASEDPWVHVLKIRSMKDINLGGQETLYDRVIGRDAPSGFTSSFGLYMSKAVVWNSANDMVIYFANKKVGNENATFADMTPDASAPGQPAQEFPPNAPSPVGIE